MFFIEGGVISITPPPQTPSRPPLAFASSEYAGADPNDPRMSLEYHPRLTVEYDLKIPEDCALGPWRAAEGGACSAPCHPLVFKRVFNVFFAYLFLCFGC